MPNHIHLILVIVDGVSPNQTRPTKTESGTVGALISTYKSVVTSRINQLRGDSGTTIWQRGYYDRIIRNERELNAIRDYIANNPQRWAEDRDNLDSLLAKMTYHP